MSHQAPNGSRIPAPFDATPELRAAFRAGWRAARIDAFGTMLMAHATRGLVDAGTKIAGPLGALPFLVFGEQLSGAIDAAQRDACDDDAKGGAR